MAHKPEITAKTADGFELIELQLSRLPESIYNQVVSAKKNVLGVECTLKTVYQNDEKVSLPTCVTSIGQGDDGITVYTNDDFTFQIPKNKPELRVDFNFNCEIKPKTEIKEEA